MLAQNARVTKADDYRAAVRKGARFSSPTLVAYVRRSGAPTARFGFIVSKQVGVAVVRNRVRRRLKAASYDYSPGVSGGVDVVVRALPAAATASFAQLKRDLGRSLTKSAVLVGSTTVES